MAVNQLGLDNVAISPEQAYEICEKYSGLSAEQIAVRMRPPEPPPCPPLPPRRLSEVEVATRLRDAEAGLKRLERAQGRENFDCQALKAEVKGGLELLIGEYTGVLKDIESGVAGGASRVVLDTSFFAKLRESHRLLSHLIVVRNDEEFLANAKSVFRTLQDWPVKISPEASPALGGS